MAVEPDDSVPGWREVLAVGILAEDLSPAGIARVTGWGLDMIDGALATARSAHAIDDDGHVTADIADEVLDELDPHRRALVHARLAHRLLTRGPDAMADAVIHLRASGAAAASAEMIGLTEHGGRLCLSLGDYDTAAGLLGYADDIDVSDDHRRRALRLIDLASALDGLGDVAPARAALASAVSLAELAGDHHLVARAAARHTLPADWHAGDTRSVGLLHRAEALPLSTDDAILVTAARAIAEMRIPIHPDEDRQFAWVTRPEVAQPLAADARDRSRGAGDEARLFALMAWRSTHRSPRYLDERRQVSAEALELAQRLRDAALQVDLAIFAAVDALEAADRAAFDRSLAVATWVAEGNGNPRLRWRSMTLAAGGAHLDGDLAEAQRLAKTASEFARQANSPGAWSSELMFAGQVLVDLDDPVLMAPHCYDESFIGMLSPLARAGVAYFYARNDRFEEAGRQVRRALRQIDEEASMLMLASRLAAAGTLVPDDDLRRELVAVLEPWSDRVAIDSNGWWCDGPVSLWLVGLHLALGDSDPVPALLDHAHATIEAINDVRGRRRLDALRRQWASLPAGPRLTERELHTLTRMCAGATNLEIAAELALSPSTVRNDTMSIYRKLGVRGRAEAATRAGELGLVSRTSSRPAPPTH